MFEYLEDLSAPHSMEEWTTMCKPSTKTIRAPKAMGEILTKSMRGKKMVHFEEEEPEDVDTDTSLESISSSSDSDEDQRQKDTFKEHPTRPKHQQRWDKILANREQRTK